MDYEDSLQRAGFRFRIQVNDKGEDNDNDKYHVAQSWVTVKLRDINDNKPIFEKANIEAHVRENARVGKTLERFRATDPDIGGKSKVRYVIDRSSDRRRQVGDIAKKVYFRQTRKWTDKNDKCQNSNISCSYAT